MLSLVADSNVLHILIIRIWVHVRLLLFPIETTLPSKILYVIDTMIVPLLRINCITRYHRNLGHLGLFVHMYLL